MSDDARMTKPKLALVTVDPHGAALWIEDDKPVHVTVRAGEPHASVYIDGVCVIEPGRMGPFDGRIDEVAVFDQALTLDEVKTMAQRDSQAG